MSTVLERYLYIYFDINRPPDCLEDMLSLTKSGSPLELSDSNFSADFDDSKFVL